MTTLRCCTLTGVDEVTNLDALAKVSNDHPLSEWAVLYSENRMQKDKGIGRYPRKKWIHEFVNYANENNIYVALHLCGNDALRFLREDDEIHGLASLFDRVQLNVSATQDRIADIEIENVRRTLHQFTYSRGYGHVIFQYNTANAKFCKMLGSSCEYLIDNSGGNGIKPDNWESSRQFHGSRIGYAGGLGPNNIEKELHRIALSSGDKPFWIDMESSLRSQDDRFDLEKCTQILRSAAQFVMQSYFDAGKECANSGIFSKDVENLTGMSLDWWVGLACGYAMNPPPVNACRATYFSRQDGLHNGFCPSEQAGDLSIAIDDSDIGCIKRDGCWMGITSQAEYVKGSSRNDAMLKALIVENFGQTLNENPAANRKFMARWVGDVMTDELLPSILHAKSKELKFARP